MNPILILVLFFSYLLLSVVEKKNKLKSTYWFVVFTFCYVIANRALVVPDTYPYMTYYLNLDTNIFEYHITQFELGFQTLSKIIKLFCGSNYVFYFFVLAFLCQYIIMESVKKLYALNSHVLNGRLNGMSQDKILPLILYLSFFGIYYTGIVLRAGLAIALIVYLSVFCCDLDKRKKKFFIIFFLFFLAFLFHLTAIIGIIIILIIIYTKRVTLKSYLLLWGGIGFIYFSNLASLLVKEVSNLFFGILANDNSNFTKFLYYQDDLIRNQGVSFKFLFFWLLALLLLNRRGMPFFYYKYLNVYFAGLFIVAIFRPILLIERISDYFLIFSFIVEFLYLKSLKPKYSMLLCSILVTIQLFFSLRIANVA